MANRYLDYDGLLYFWQKIKELLGGKVDVETGKGLSTNDYTTAEKNKLAGIASGAEVNQNAFSTVKVGSTNIAADAKTDTLTVIAGDNITLTPNASSDSLTIAATDTTYGDATADAHGLMTAAMVTKLAGIAEGAQVNTVTGVKGNSESSYRTGQINITAANIGLGNVTNNKQVKGLSSGTTAGHVVTWGSDGYTVADSGFTIGKSVPADAVFTDTTYSDATSSAHGLMTAAMVTKLAGIDTGAEVNVIETVKVNGTALTPSSKAVNISVPTKTSDITNDSGFITSDDVPEGAAASTTTPKMNGTAAVGTETAFARGDHVHPSDTAKANLASPTFTGTPKAPTAAAGTNTTQIATTAFVSTAIANAQTGAAMFQGTVTKASDISGLTAYKKGYYWLVQTAGTYAGQACEAGDMIFAIADYSSSYKAADFTVIQNNMDVRAITNAEIDTILAA